MPVNTNTNAYTLIFATIMVIVVAVLLSFLAEVFKERTRANVLLDKMNSIMLAVDPSMDKSKAKDAFENSIKPFVVTADGQAKAVDNAIALDIDLSKELKKESADRGLPIYQHTNAEGKKNFIVPLFGAGLWDAIGGYLAIQPDFNTVAGAVFTHVGETPGLGAEIATDWFQGNFSDEKLFNDKREFVGIKVLKGKGNPDNAKPHIVDGISGATITGNGVQYMIDDCLRNYIPYFKKNG